MILNSSKMVFNSCIERVGGRRGVYPVQNVTINRRKFESLQTFFEENEVMKSFRLRIFRLQDVLMMSVKTIKSVWILHLQIGQYYQWGPQRISSSQLQRYSLEKVLKVATATSTKKVQQDWINHYYNRVNICCLKMAILYWKAFFIGSPFVHSIA